MPELPASVRLCLWATTYFAGGVRLQTALDRAVPDADEHHGAWAWVEQRRELGERVLLVALPRPGHLGDLPGGAALRDEALLVGECVYAPGLGGGMVPRVQEYGPVGDRGVLVTWEFFDSDPVPAHVLDSWSARQAERELLAAMVEATDALGDSPPPWASRGLADVAAEHVDRHGWSLPAGLPARAMRVLTLAADVGMLADLALASPQDGPTVAAIQRRESALRTVRHAAEDTLARAANVAALQLAGLRPEGAD